MNQIFVIQPYFYNGSWVFDDADVGLVREPFVSGIPEMINELVKDLPRANEGFRLLFSANPFPEYEIKLLRLREEIGGYWYQANGSEHEGWLCPAMFKYFESPPEHIYAKVESAKIQEQTESIQVSREEVELFIQKLDRGDLDTMRTMLTELQSRFTS